ncbi:MAG: glycoside hydrolase family 3 protein [Oscillospiraceae bacterium]|nr:glycoside hydrolase family 3 protein [Oscillospiraceae bacterium]
MKKVLAALLTVFLLLSLFLPVSASEDDACAALLASLSTEEKLSQMLMLSFQNYEGDPVTELPDALRELLERRCFGGVILFAENARENEQTARLTDAMQRANAAEGRPQLLFAIDQEGGSVTRLGHGTAMPGSMALGAVGDPAETEAAAALIGGELQALGIHVDFAPVVDVNSNPANPIIGLRSFSDDPSLAAEQGLAFLRGLKQAGAIGALKHFPGHGDTDTDSHTGLPCVEKTKDELLKTDLVPFRACIEAGAEIVMTAHIQYPQIETQPAVSIATGEEITPPATLSGAILTDLLREELGFTGVIVTDAMNMGAIAKHFDPIDAARRAVEAGADLILMPVELSSPEGIQALDQYLGELTRLAEDGLISTEKIDAAVLRILRLKQAHELLTPYDGSQIEQRVERALSSVGSDEHHAQEWALAKKAVTLLKNTNDALPITDFARKIVVLTAYDNELLSMDYALGLLRENGKLPQDANVEVWSRQSQPAETVLALARDAGHVVAVSEALGSSYYMSDDAALLDEVLRTVHASGGKFTLLSAELPYDAARFPDADAILLCYGSKGMPEKPRNTRDTVRVYGPNLPAALYLSFTPDESPSGHVPVRIPKLDADFLYTDEILYSRGSGLVYPGFDREEAPAPPETAPIDTVDAESVQTSPAPVVWIAAAVLVLTVGTVFFVRRRRF